jgi:hypothetical protein
MLAGPLAKAGGLTLGAAVTGIDQKPNNRWGGGAISIRISVGISVHTVLHQCW